MHVDGTLTQAFLGRFILALPGGAVSFFVAVPGPDGAYAARARTAGTDGYYQTVVVALVGATVLAMGGSVESAADVAVFQGWANAARPLTVLTGLCSCDQVRRSHRGRWVRRT